MSRNISARNNLLPILIRKELTQFRRNKFLPKLLLMLPIMLMLLMPWVTTMDVRNIGVAVVDDDQSSFSRRVVSHIASSDYFRYKEGYRDYLQSLEALDKGEIDVIISIPEHFERDLQLGTQKPISLVANAVNATKGGQGLQYSLQTIATTLHELQTEQGVVSLSDAVATENRYNPTGNYRYFMVPALMIILLILVCCFLPALNIVSEKEAGTIEQLNVTPITPLQFTLAKLVPYWIMGLIELTLAMIVARLLYGLVPQGSVLTIFTGAILFIICMSGFGVTMANISDTLQQTIYIMFFFVMIFMLMSGLLTPLASMPEWAQNVTYLFPPRYFVEIMRSVYLKGTTFVELGGYMAALAGMAALFCLLAMKTYRKQA